MKKVFDYSVYPECNEKAYKNAVALIAKHYPEFKKEKELIDVDSTAIQVFSLSKKTVVRVFNDTDVGAVYVKSEVDLSRIDFSKIKESA